VHNFSRIVSKESGLRRMTHKTILFPNLVVPNKLPTSSFFLYRPLLPCAVAGFLLVNLLDNW
jgi:hypothetical protein